METDKALIRHELDTIFELRTVVTKPLVYNSKSVLKNVVRPNRKKTKNYKKKRTDFKWDPVDLKDDNFISLGEIHAETIIDQKDQEAVFAKCGAEDPLKNGDGSAKDDSDADDIYSLDKAIAQINAPSALRPPYAALYCSSALVQLNKLINAFTENSCAASRTESSEQPNTDFAAATYKSQGFSENAYKEYFDAYNPGNIASSDPNVSGLRMNSTQNVLDRYSWLPNMSPEPSKSSISKDVYKQDVPCMLDVQSMHDNAILSSTADRMNKWNSDYSPLEPIMYDAFAVNGCMTKAARASCARFETPEFTSMQNRPAADSQGSFSTAKVHNNEVPLGKDRNEDINIVATRLIEKLFSCSGQLSKNKLVKIETVLKNALHERANEDNTAHQMVILRALEILEDYSQTLEGRFGSQFSPVTQRPESGFSRPGITAFNPVERRTMQKPKYPKCTGAAPRSSILSRLDEEQSGSYPAVSTSSDERPNIGDAGLNYAAQASKCSISLLPMRQCSANYLDRDHESNQSHAFFVNSYLQSKVFDIIE